MPNNPLYNVLLLNDDETPMEFVVNALRAARIGRASAEGALARSALYRPRL
jgi:ATP-dependent Clp protease adapter protein ClpS